MGVRISILTVVKNGAHCLDRTIQSVLQQEYQPLQYIIVDGGSSDGSLEIAQAYEGRCQVYSIPDANPTEGINNGLALCDGDMVGILNCGDWYAPETLQLAASAFTPSGIVHGHMVTWVEGKPAHEVFPNPQAIYREMSVNFATCFFCAPLMRTPPYFDHTFDYATDYEFILRSLKQGATLQEVPHVLAHIPLDGRSAQHWVAALRDVSKSRVRHGCAPWSAYGYLAYRVFKGYTRLLLERVGLQKVIDAYRNTLASQRKLPADRMR